MPMIVANRPAPRTARPPAQTSGRPLRLSRIGSRHTPLSEGWRDGPSRRFSVPATTGSSEPEVWGATPETAGTSGPRWNSSSLSRKRRNTANPERPRTPLSNLKKGQTLQGRVRVVLESAVLIKCRAETDAYLPERFMGHFGPPSALKPGAQVRCHIYKVDPKKEILQVTLLQGGKVIEGTPRKDVQQALRPGMEVSGKVKKILQRADKDGWVKVQGAFIDIGAQYDCFVGPDSMLPPVGQSVRCQILPDGLDKEQLRVRRRIGAELLPDTEPAAAAAVGAGAGAAAGTSSIQGDYAALLEDDDDEEDDDYEDDAYDKYGYLDDY